MNNTNFQIFRQTITYPIKELEIVYRIHATRRMFERNISEKDIAFVLDTGQVIESYENDTPFPSVLINGKDLTGQYIHLVVAMDIAEKRLYIITAYRPDPTVWENDFNRRIL